ncbi:MAG TPA: hypothetical protein VGN63_19055 [Flavisolibacter sp.]|jgi:hypothetical protein|nr:hypothetical protein [Flavisolibacter sp.]
MSEKNQPKPEKPSQGNIPQKGQGDRIEKGQQGITPPKPRPQGPREGDLSEGAPGWTPPKNRE